MGSPAPVLAQDDLLYHELTRHGWATFFSEPMTDEQFLALCEEHPEFPIETTAEGEIIIMPPAGPVSAYQNNGLSAQVWNWAERSKRGRAFDSSGIFVLPSGARRSPDSSFISHERLDALGAAKRRTLWHICPDFVVELRSKTDRRRRLEMKMEEYMANGAKLGWLIDPADRTVTVYRPRRKPEMLLAPKVMEGEGPVAGLKVKMRPLWWDAS